MERAATNKISKTAASSHGRSARSEGDGPRCGDFAINTDKVNYLFEPVRHRQFWRCRCKRVRDQKNRGADRAITLVVATRLSRTGLRRLRNSGVLCAGKIEMGRTGDAAEVYMPEGENKLERKR
jgi:hypothetical protein